MSEHTGHRHSPAHVGHHHHGHHSQECNGAKVQHDFNDKAAKWDENPLVHEMANKALESIQTHVPLRGDMNVLDFGCGTGNLSFLLLPFVQHVHGIDSAEGMIEQFQKKIQQGGQTRLSCEALNLSEPYPKQLSTQYDLIVSHVAFHHIENVPGMINLLASHIKPGGYLVISDLQKTPTAEEFHSKKQADTVFHHGFDPERLEAWMRADLSTVEIHKDAYTVKKKVDDGQRAGMLNDAAFLLAVGRKE
ncbi:hypothetical protein SpCBS45565_g07935 [Spizellomyces sp. 'palustris']|nr:hypothetical protein SpCBS45565_g07935 [Spizellomyces sp. 'palustris']